MTELAERLRGLTEYRDKDGQVRPLFPGGLEAVRAALTEAADHIEALEAALREVNEQIKELLPYPDPLVRKRLERIRDTAHAAISQEPTP
jgi:hypothetical protein